MMDHLAGAALRQREVERLEHQLGAQMSLHYPTHPSCG